ncbi:MAG TPA: hypothetical protein VLW85_08015 [Myxococcales bacterium]|nr:hypothetical protein [Myxococcales bacterium]
MDLLAQAQGFSEGMPALAPGSPQKSDILDGLLPSWRFARGELRAGRLPWWNPVFTGGVPELSSLFESLVTPRFLLYAALPEAQGYGLGLVVQAALGGLGMFLFCRRRLGWFASLFGAVTFMFCGFNAAWAQWPHTATAAMIPFMLWALAGLLDRPSAPSAALLGLFVALVLYGGFPSVAAYGFYLATTLAVAALAPGVRDPGRLRLAVRTAAYALAGVTLGVGLTAWQLGPSVEFLRHLDLGYREVHRAVGLDPAQIRFLLNMGFGARAPVEESVYVGLLPLLLLVPAAVAVVRGKSRGAGMLSPAVWFVIFFGVLAVRYHFPAAFSDFVCGLPVLRSNPNMRLAIVVDIALAVLGAWGLQALAEALARFGRGMTVAALALIAFQVVDTTRLLRYHNGVVPAARFLPETPLIADAEQHITPGQSVISTWPAFMTAGTLGSYGFTEFFRHDFRRPADQAFLDHGMNGRWSLLTSAAVDLPRIRLDSPWLVPLGIRYVFTSTVLAYQSWPHHVLHQVGGQEGAVQEFVIPPSRDVCALALVGAMDGSSRQGLLRADLRARDGTVLARSTLPLAQLHDRDWTYLTLPRLDLDGAYSVAISTSDEARGHLGVLTSGTDIVPGRLLLSGKAVDADMALSLERCNPALPPPWRVRRAGVGTLLIENPAAGPGAVLLDAAAWDAEPSFAAFDTAGARQISYLPSQRSYHVSATKPSFLVASIRDLGGWSASVDGAPAEERAYRGFLVAAAVQAGDHEVTLRYSPPRELPYAALSCFSAAVLLLSGWRARRRSAAAPVIPPCAPPR